MEEGLGRQVKEVCKFVIHLLFFFVFLITVGHVLWPDLLVELLLSQDSELDAGLLQGGALLVRQLGNGGGLVVPNVLVERRHQHQGALHQVLDPLPVWLDSHDALVREGDTQVAQQVHRLQVGVRQQRLGDVELKGGPGGPGDSGALPTTREQTIRAASHCVGLTLPGMMLDPGSLAGRLSSTGHAGSASEKSDVVADLQDGQGDGLEGPASWACASWQRGLKLVWRGHEGQASELRHMACHGLGVLGVFNPVPTAAPSARSYRSSRACWLLFRDMSTWCTYPENSWARVSGVASIRWVLPILMILLNSSCFLARCPLRYDREGRSLSCTARAVAMDMAVGKVSFENGKC